MIKKPACKPVQMILHQTVNKKGNRIASRLQDKMVVLINRPLEINELEKGL